jgi:putative hydrolase of the HAD superfamily
MLAKNELKKYLNPLSPIPTRMRPRGKLSEFIRCILFDIYGTLFISGSGDIGTAKKQSPANHHLQGLLDAYGIDKSPQQLMAAFYCAIEKKHDQLKKQNVDFPEVEIDVIWQHILPTTDLDTARGFALAFELIVNPVYPMPHLRTFLMQLKKRGILLGIVSNAQFYTQYLFPLFLNADIDEFGFDTSLCFFSYQYQHAKPSLLLFREAAEALAHMGIKDTSVLYVGNDMLNDIYPASSIGFRTALFAGDARSLRLRENDLRCRNVSPDLIVTELMQLLEYIP